jgi:hypothetical protein
MRHSRISDRHIRAVRSCRTEASDGTNESDGRFQRKQEGRSEGDVMTQPALQLQLRRFETLRAFLSTRKVLILLVELVGIELLTGVENM